MISSRIANASEQYRNAIRTCREVFTAAGREFVEPKGVKDLVNEARKLYTERSDEAGAIKEIEHARDWLTGIAVKFLRGGIQFFEDRIKELSYMSLDDDLMDNMEARLRDYCGEMMEEDGPCFDRRVAAYTKLANAVTDARPEQARRNERREQKAHDQVSRKEAERRLRRRQQEEQDQAEAKRQQEAAEAAARANREKQFDELFC